MSVWITGAAGFIGGHLTRHLQEAGHEVHGFRTDGASGERGYWLEGPVNSASLSRLLTNSGKPDTIYHLAGGSSVGQSLSDPHRDFGRTVGSTATLLEWIRLQAPYTRLVLASSAAVYGTGHAAPISKNADTNPSSPYGYHKLAAELLAHSYAKNYGVQVSIARLFSVYGPGLRKQLLWDLCGMLGRTGQARLGGTGTESRDWVHVDDVIRFLRAAAKLASPEVRILNGGTGIGTTVQSIASIVTREFDLSPNAVTFTGVPRQGDPLSLVAEPEPDLTWKIDVVEGLRDYVRWFKDQA